MTTTTQPATPAAAPAGGGVRYGLEARLEPMVLVLAAVQIVLFTIPTNILVPIVLADRIGLPPEGTAAFIRQALFLTGFASALQVLFGHRLPLTEGQAGLWWALFLGMIAAAGSFGQSGVQMMANLQGGLLAAGAFVLLLGVTRLAEHVRRWFGPAVTGTFLVLLGIQISGTFVPGALGITATQPFQPVVALVSIFIVGLVIAIASFGRGQVRNFSVLIGLAAGWLIFGLLGLAPRPAAAEPAILVPPAIFPWGPPSLDLGVVLICLVGSIVNLGNVMGAMVSMEYVLDERFEPGLYSRGTGWTGIAHLLAGLGGVIGTSPFAGSAGVVAVTGIATRLPFLLGSVALAILSLVPVVGALFAAIPPAAGYAVLIVAFTQMWGFGLADLTRLGLTQRDIYRVGIPILVGTGLLVIPADAFATLPAAIRPLLSNGTIVGTLLALVFDRAVQGSVRGA